MNLTRYLANWKIMLVSMTLIGILSGGFVWLHFQGPLNPPPSANCPQPPRNIDPTKLTDKQRDYYGYMPRTPGLDTTQFDKAYQLHGVHYCSDTDKNTNIHS